MQTFGFGIRGAGQVFFSTAARHRVGILLVIILAAGVATAWGQTGSPPPLAEAIVARMAQARVEGRARLRPYVVTRSYKLFGKDESKSRSEVTANIAFDPPDSKKYSIQQTTGNAVGQILVRRMLVGEAEVEKEHVATDLSTDNYNFRFIRQEYVVGQSCFVLELLPRRNEQYLLHGTIWIDGDTYLPLRFEGEFAKSPSWWVKDVRLTFVYSEVGGMWLQTSTEAAADVRILGRATMISRDEKYKIPELVAAASSAPPNLLEMILAWPFRSAGAPEPAK